MLQAEKAAWLATLYEKVGKLQVESDRHRAIY